MRRALACAAAALALGCVVVSTYPIRGEPPYELDPALAGSWRVSDAKEAPAGAAGRLTFTSHGDHYVVEAGDAEGSVLEVTTARLGGQRYLNVLEIGPQSSGHYLLARYRIEGGRLWIAAMDRSAAARAVERGELRAAGKNEAREGSDLVLASSSAELESYLRSHDPLELFPEPADYAVRDAAP